MRNIQFIGFLLILFFSNASYGQVDSKNFTKDQQEYAKVFEKIEKINVSNMALIDKQLAHFTTVYDFIIQNPKNELLLNLVAESVNLQLKQMDSLIALIDTSLISNMYMTSVLYARKRISITETGKPFPSFSLKDTLGVNTDIENYKGKILLIDFWSSWCIPCRAEIPSLKKILAKYGKKDFEIIGVSVDEDKQEWLKAIEKDKQNWKHFCSLQPFQENQTAQYFSIYSIPDNYLINKNGIILGQNLSPLQITLLLEKQN
ncbi:MAG: TlpA family protein disulfide reductase [Sphingobacteriia bacterium]|nr:MAG: TlpA family protein disulfide reductase [Sphingobacteriia bacterium]